MVQIKVEQYEGPLDLLLQLIEDQKLDVSTLALAKVTEQFLHYVKNLQEKNPLNLADFLVIAAKLLVIKSKSLLPNLELGEEEEEAAFDLTQQLLRYKKYKEVAFFLRKLDLKRHQSWTRDIDFNDMITFVPDPEVTVDVLANSLKSLAVELKDIVRLPQQVMKEVVSISEKISHIQQLISDKVEMSLSNLLKDAKSKTEVIVTFLALLELTKQRIVHLEQDVHFADIIIRKTI
ncbi:MAG: segregation/condensation protein A [Candidatus Doudnabacteria bacterium]|nr:segregation/condensation protein A [Candidatus Doudnabacteria bacterium]